MSAQLQLCTVILWTMSILLLVCFLCLCHGHSLHRRQVFFGEYQPVECVTSSGKKSLCVLLVECDTIADLLKTPGTALSQLIKTDGCQMEAGAGICCPVEEGAPDLAEFERNVDKMPGTTTEPATPAPAIEPLKQISTTLKPQKVTQSPVEDSKRVVVPTDNFLPVNCGTSDVLRKRVVGGGEAPQGAWPWMALLLYRNRIDGQIYPECGGVLVTDQHILTAAHCLQTRNQLVTVRLGEHRYGTDTDGAILQDIPILQTFPHEEFNQSLATNDIAVIKLQQKVKFTANVNAICLPRDPQIRSQNNFKPNPYVAGWGRTTEGGNASDILRETQLPVLSQPTCIKAYEEVLNVRIDDRSFCAGFVNGTTSACQGDSGGPLMWANDLDNRYVLLGIVSVSVGCARAGFPGVYTRVDRFNDWILSKLK